MEAEIGEGIGKEAVPEKNFALWGRAVVNAFQILSKLTGGTFDIPGSLVDVYPQLKKIARTDGQMTLDL